MSRIIKLKNLVKANSRNRKHYHARIFVIGLARAYKVALPTHQVYVMGEEEKTVETNLVFEYALGLHDTVCCNSLMTAPANEIRRVPLVCKAEVFVRESRS